MENTQSPETLRKWYEDEIKRKDAEIERLKQENAALLKTSLRQGEKLADFEARLKELSKKK